MSDDEILIEVAKLDGKEYHKPTEEEVKRGSYYQYEPDYLNSRDAIMPVIEKQPTLTQHYILDILAEMVYMRHKNTCLGVLFATPRQLCLALLKATGRFSP